MTLRRVRYATVSACGGVLACIIGTLVYQIWLVLRRGFPPKGDAPHIDQFYKPNNGLAPRPSSENQLRLALLGDSTAAGVGVEKGDHSIGGWLGRLLAQDGWRVRLTSLAVPGSVTSDLGTQVSRALLFQPDVAVILIGAGDLFRRVSPDAMDRDLGTAIRRLHEAGVNAVVGACPDLGAVRLFPQPLRMVMSWYGRSAAQIQQSAVQKAGGKAIDLGRETGPIFRADPSTISKDGFHPSSDGYRLWAETLFPAVSAAARTHVAR